MREENKTMEENKSGILKKLFYFVIIPFLLILTIVLIISTVSGLNIFQEAAKIPVIGSLFSSKDMATTSIEEYDQQINKLQAQLKNQEKKVEDLQSELEKKDQEIATLQEEKKNFETNQNNQAEPGNENTNGQNETDTQWNEVIKTYEKMKPQSAANILAQMDETTALNIMTDLKEDTLARILEKMPVEKAANFTAKLANQ
jgi:flagellar protein FlbB